MLLINFVYFSMNCNIDISYLLIRLKFHSQIAMLHPNFILNQIMILLIISYASKWLIKLVLHYEFSSAGFAAFTSRVFVLCTFYYGLLDKSALGIDAVGTAGEGTEITIFDYFFIILLSKLQLATPTRVKIVFIIRLLKIIRPRHRHLKIKYLLSRRCESYLRLIYIYMVKVLEQTKYIELMSP